jgi:tetratricopeptide (TPR) repeat protein
MEQLRERIKNEVIPALNLDTTYEFRNKPYHILEDCDLYGFSCLKVHKEEYKADPLEAFRNDENWFNPGNIELMMKAYEVDEPYASFSENASVNVAAFNYLTIKREQNRYLSNQVVNEGMVLLNHSKIADSIKKFSSALSMDETNPEAYFARANAYVRLRDWGNAFNDIQKSLASNPTCEASQELLRVVRMNYKEQVAKPTVALPVANENSLNSRLILKLQESLNKRKDFVLEGEDEEKDDSKSDSDDESSEGDRSGSSSRKKESKKRKRHHKKHKTKKDKDRKKEKHKHKKSKH